MAQLKMEQQIQGPYFEPSSRPMQELDRQISGLQDILHGDQIYLPQTETYETNSNRRQLQLDALQKSSQLIGLRAKAQEERKKMEETSAKLAGLDTTEDALHRVEREISVLEQNYLLYKRQLEEARIQDAMDSAQFSNVSVLSPPVASVEPVKPRRGLLAMAGTALGFLLTAGTLFLRESLRPSAHSREATSAALGVPVLVRVPEVRQS
jgi:uncharacterized protein involved in exopolysaccharide biosynthesis